MLIAVEIQKADSFLCHTEISCSVICPALFTFIDYMPPPFVIDAKSWRSSIVQIRRKQHRVTTLLLIDTHSGMSELITKGQESPDKSKGKHRLEKI